MDINVEERAKRAGALFMEGYNCSQSVVGAFADVFGVDEKLALRFASSFGGGIGRMRMTCGAACGMFMLAGLETGATEGADREAKALNYKLVQQLAEKFKQQKGSLICAELLNLRKNAPIQPMPDERTEAYYKTRPCVRMVEDAARIYAEHLLENQQPEKPISPLFA